MGTANRRTDESIRLLEINKINFEKGKLLGLVFFCEEEKKEYEKEIKSSFNNNIIADCCLFIIE